MSLTAYAASCVRVCALRNALLRPGEWNALTAADAPAAVIERLRGRGALSAGAADILSAERSEHQSVIRNTEALLRFARGDIARLLRCFINYYDLLNVENVIFRVHAMAAASPLSSPFYDTGAFGLLHSRDLAAVTNYAALARTLRRSSLAGAFNAALARYRDDENAMRMVETVEEAFFTEWVRSAERCGFRLQDRTDGTAMAVFLVARAVEAAVRLKFHRQAETSRIARWLSFAAGSSRLQECLDILSGGDDVSAVRELAARLLPPVKLDAKGGNMSGPFGDTILLNTIVAIRAEKATGRVMFNADFLTSFLIFRICQAWKLTILIESKEVGVPMNASFFTGGAL